MENQKINNKTKRRNAFMQDCVFCKINKKELSADIIFEDEDCFVFSSLDPITEGHVLIVPKKHFHDIFDIDTNILTKIIVIAQKIARDFIEEKRATGINLLHASGKDAQQSISHFHFHLVPRFPNDNLDLWIENNC